MSTKKRVVLTAAQKHEICKAKEKNLNIKNIDLANQYSVGKSTITDILKEKERWLAIEVEEQGEIKKFRGQNGQKLKKLLVSDDVEEELKLSELIDNLPTNKTNDHLTAFDYIHAEDGEVNE
ncbi:9623_t:CDS:2, partial [Cetraspora pellucida]